MGNDMIAKVETEEKGIVISNDDVRKYFCPNATETEMGLFINIAKINNLNPFKKELFLVKYGTYPASIITGYETYLKRAERSGKLTGWRVWTEGEVPDMKACIEIRRKDWEDKFYHEVEYSEYCAKTKEGNVTRFWAEKPKTMLKKVVMAQGFRFAFSDELSGLPYIQEELNTLDIQANTTQSTKPKVSMPQEKKLEFATSTGHTQNGHIPDTEPEVDNIDIEEDIKQPTIMEEQSKKNLQLVRDVMAKCGSLDELKTAWSQEMKDYRSKFLPSDYEKAVKSKDYFKKILENRKN